MFSSESFNFLGCIIFVYIGIGTCSCDNHLYVPPNGEFFSPKYPENYVNNTNCIWRITATESKGTIVLRILDLDIEPDEPEMCGHTKRMPCCVHNWLSVPLSGVGKVKTQQICGQHIPAKLIKVQAPEVSIKFHISRLIKGGRGFQLSYKLVSAEECSTPGMVPCGTHADSGCYHNTTQRCDGTPDCDNGQDEAQCPACQFICATDRSRCYSKDQKCNGIPDCDDYSDEVDCGFCEKGKARCSSATHHCFHPTIERCNGRFECPWGEDEVGCVPGCEGKIACSIGEGCYTPAQRCDSLSDCHDSSDESLCPHELCATMHDMRQCHNGHCLPVALWCDGTDDCGDNSDEESCLKNSVIAIAIMGSLFCGLLLVVAVGCAFRIFGRRYATLSSSNYHLHINPHLASRLRMSTSVSLPTLMHDDFFHREPPPAYSVAVGESEVSVQAVPTSRPRRLRRTRLRPIPPPQVVAKPPDSPACEGSSSQSSPSRGSSSSYLSGTDDTLLLSS